MRTLRILGTRGVPARHGGFETFAEDLARHLVGSGWQVTVYCQGEGIGPIHADEWEGIQRVWIPVRQPGAVGTIVFDWKATRHAARERGLCLTLGYNTAIFCLWLRMGRTANLINMDGLEWKRSKYGLPQRLWLLGNEVAGSWIGDHLIADHPEIARHLSRWTRPAKITTIPYGSRPVNEAPTAPLEALGLAPDGFALVIARPEPENSILEIVEAFSRRPRGKKLVLLGEYRAEHSYQRRVRAAASPEVVFAGAIYERDIVESLRAHCWLYLHGHTVGGTNPSLVEALAAGSAVLAQDNAFNRWVAGPLARYFQDTDECALRLDELAADEAPLAQMRQASRRRHAEQFTLDGCLQAYEALLSIWAPGTPGRADTTGDH